MTFATACADRALTEGEQFAKKDLDSVPGLYQGVALGWKYAGGDDLDYQKDIKKVHEEAATATGNVDDAGTDEVASNVAFTVERMLAVLWKPDKGAIFAKGAADGDVMLFTLLYQKPQDVEAREREWQGRALNLVRSVGGKALNRGAFTALEDYPRPPVIKAFANRRR